MSSSYIPSYRDVEVTVSDPKTSTSSKATVHYVEAGDPKNRKLLLLHGFPSSSFQYRDLIPMFSDTHHVLAPDYPGYGLSTVSEEFVFNFENITSVMAAWLQEIGVKEAAIYIQDFGAPVGFRLLTTNALKATAIVTQNGNAYVEGLGKDVFGPLMEYWRTASTELRDAIAGKMLTLEGAKARFVVGTPEKDLHLLDPLTWELAYSQNLAGPVNGPRQLAMLYDYRTNVEMYPTFQKYIRESKVPILAVWGKGDPAFIPPGAEAFRTDAPDADIHLIDGAHFALESSRWEIARLMKEFFAAKGI